MYQSYCIHKMTKKDFHTLVERKLRNNEHNDLLSAESAIVIDARSFYVTRCVALHALHEFSHREIAREHAYDI